MKKQNISVKEIAELAGTSTATVSRVLNRNGRYSKDTEQRVLEVVKKTGYRRNELARGLRASNSNLVGILVPDITNVFYASLVKVIQDALLKDKIVALACNTNEDHEQAKRFVRIFEDHNADGIIYIGNNDLTRLPHLPVMYVDRDPRAEMDVGDQNYAMIECDNILGGYLAGKELVRKGCREFVYAAYRLEISTHQKRLQGFRQALQEAGMDIPEDHILDAQWSSMKEGYKLMRQAYEKFPGTDGVFFAADSLAVGALQFLNRHGISVPKRVKLVGFDDAGMCEVMNLTTVRQPVDEIGQLAAERIIQMIAGEKISMKRQRLPVELIVRGTT